MCKVHTRQTLATRCAFVVRPVQVADFGSHGRQTDRKTTAIHLGGEDLYSESSGQWTNENQHREGLWNKCIDAFDVPQRP